jgi:hypothetical protein
MHLRTPTTFQAATIRVVGARCYLDQTHNDFEAQHQQRRNELKSALGERKIN